VLHNIIVVATAEDSTEPDLGTDVFLNTLFNLVSPFIVALLYIFFFNDFLSYFNDSLVSCQLLNSMHSYSELLDFLGRRGHSSLDHPVFVVSLVVSDFIIFKVMVVQLVNDVVLELVKVTNHLKRL
jgi:hypothetical protein